LELIFESPPSPRRPDVSEILEKLHDNEDSWARVNEQLDEKTANSIARALKFDPHVRVSIRKNGDVVTLYAMCGSDPRPTRKSTPRKKKGGK